MRSARQYDGGFAATGAVRLCLTDAMSSTLCGEAEPRRVIENNDFGKAKPFRTGRGKPQKTKATVELLTITAGGVKSQTT